MKYPLHTQSQPVSGEAAKKLLESIDSGSTVINDRMLALAKRIAARRLALVKSIAIVAAKRSFRSTELLAR